MPDPSSRCKSQPIRLAPLAQGKLLRQAQGKLLYLGYMAHPPKDLQGTLWSSDVSQLDLEKNKAYIIHQVLTFGTMNQLKWLFKTYRKSDVIDTFIHQPMKMYPKHIYWFTKNHLLSLQHTQLDEQNYVTSLFGPTRLRAQASI